MIDLQADLGPLVTRGTLQAGIAYAVGRSGVVEARGGAALERLFKP